MTNDISPADAVARSEARLAGILAIAADAIVSIDDRQCIVLFNQGAEQIFGYSAAEVLGRPLDILMPERFRSAHHAHINDFGRSSVISRQMGERQQIWALRKDGREFPAEASISKLDTGGERTFTVVLRDVSTQLERKLELEQVAERLSLALEAGNIGLFEFDNRNGAHYWSPTYRRILGVAADAPASLEQMLAMVLPEDRADVGRVLSDVRSGTAADDRYRIEHRIVRPDGEVRWLARDLRTYLETDGVTRRVARIVGVVRDITERKLLEQQLERLVAERTAELSALLDALPDGVVQMDLDRIVRRTNVAMERLFGYGRGELIGRHASELYATAADNAVVVQSWSALAAGGAIHPVRVEYRRKDGSTFPAIVVGNPVRDGNGGIVSRVAIVRDITEELQRQQALTQSQRMEAFGQLTGGIAHDFNNLLTVISGNHELLAMRLEDEKAATLLRRAQEAADMGARLTARLLTFARRRPLEPVEINLNDQITGMVDLLRRSIGDHVTLTTNLSPNLPLVRADASEIENAVLNLAINARDAMPGGGMIVIETGVLHVDDADTVDGRLAPGDYVRLSVSDTGAGMPPDILARAFEPFFTTKQPGKGTGLGLSTVYGAFRQLGGTVQIYSEIGRGTTVSAYLPRSEGRGPLASSSSERSAAPLSAGERVLIVEDSPELLSIARQHLETLGYRVEVADTGPAAVAVMTQPGARFDLVLSDVVMPGGMSGYDVADWVAANAAATRVLLTSGYPGDIAAGPGGPRDGIRLLRKPYSRLDLARAVREVLDAAPP